MEANRDIVITGMGVFSPIGIGVEEYWSSLEQRRSGVRWLDLFGESGPPDEESPNKLGVKPDLSRAFGGDVVDFEPKRFIRPRKSLKVMCRDIQLAFAAADAASAMAGLADAGVNPERMGVVFGSEMMHCELPEVLEAYRCCMVDGHFDFNEWGGAAMAELYPLWMLKYLPNMPACHIGIAQDARGPNNSLTLGDVSSHLAIAEATRVVERGQADVMIAGGANSWIHPWYWVRNQMLGLSERYDAPAAASRPFDAGRDGTVNGEGAAAFVVERREHAVARGATVLAKILGSANTCKPRRAGEPLEGDAIRNAISTALCDAGLEPSDVGHVSAQGNSTIDDDRLEARAIRDVLGDVPVTALKSYFGNIGSGGGAVEMVGSVLGLQRGLIPPTLNYEQPDPECPVNVVHGPPAESRRPTALMLSHTRNGQAAAVVLAAE